MPDAQFVAALHRSLARFQTYPCSTLLSPPNVSKRASVAVVIRVEPDPSHRPVGDDSTATTIDGFFGRPWVRHGEPEVLFIKRAARTGDRWTSHVACPGGKRDPHDADDFETAVRETMEEVGIDLSHAITCGKLPDRLVTTSWGTVPLMILCPFIFLLTSPVAPAFNLQPSEVASAHWVPLRILLEPAFRTTFSCDVSDRLARQGGAIVRWGLRASLGQMQFAAIRLWPSHSVYSISNDFFAPVKSRVWDTSLRLWGLTLGVVQDLLETLPPEGSALAMWEYPTFTAPDARLMSWIVTRNTRRQNKVKASFHSHDIAMPLETRGNDEKPNNGQLGENTDSLAVATQPACSVDLMLNGYYAGVTQAVWITLCGRAVFAFAIITTCCWRWRGWRT